MERSRRRAITARIINPFTPRAVLDARPETAFRARVLVALLLFNGAAFTLVHALGALAGFAWLPGLRGLGTAVVGATIVVHLACLLIFRRTGSYVLPGNIFVGWIYLLVTGAAVAVSGPDVDQALRWMLLVPLFAFLALGLRGGAVWTLLAFATNGALHGIELRFLSAEHLQAWWDWTMRAVAVTTGLVIYEVVLQRLLGLLDDERRRFAHAALHDALTGLANRAAFDLELRRRLEKARQAGHGLTLIYLDLDGFKPVNDTYGHAAGDRVLQVVARRLETAFREGDLVARVGGDEFAVILGQAGPPTPVAARLEQARQLIANPITGDGAALRVTASIGAAVAPTADESAEHLLARADAAMYRAKRSGNQVEIDGIVAG